MKICILGDSHVASLKSGWDVIKDDYPNHSLTFFAARQHLLGGLHIQGAKLTPSTKVLAQAIQYTSGGHVEINGGDYDCYLIYGLGLRLPALDRRLSTAVKSLTCGERFQNSLNYKTAIKVRKISTAPIYIGHKPMHAFNPDSSPRTENMLGYKSVFGVTYKAVDKAKFLFVGQPEKTMDQDWFTKAEYSKGSIRLDVGDRISNMPHSDSDNDHMNGEFGQLYLRDFLGAIC